MFKLTSLSTKIISMALLLALFPLVIVYFVASSLFTDALIDNIRQNLTAQAIQAGYSIDSFFYQRIRDIKMLSQADLFEEEDVAKISQYLEEIQIENHLLSDIYVLLPSGVFISAAKDKRRVTSNIQQLMLPEISKLFAETLHASQGDVLVSEALIFDGGLKVLLMTPITDDANINVIKVLMVELDLKEVESIVENFAHSIIGDKSVYVVDNDGLVLVTPDENSKVLAPFKDLKVNPNLLNAFSNQGENGNIIYTDVENDKVIAGFADMAEFGINQALDWSIIGLAPIKQIASPVYTLRYFLILLVLSLTLVTAIAAILVGRSISKPILKSVKVITDISNGRLDSKIELVNGGEVGQLSESIRKMQNNIRNTANTAENIAEGNFDVNITVLSEHDVLGKSLSSMVSKLREMRSKQVQQDWLKTGLNQLNEKVSGEQDLVVLGENVINFLTPYLNAQVGAFYLYVEGEEDKYLKMVASHAYVWRKQVSNKIYLSEGLVGQAAFERKPIALKNITSDYIYISSGLGETAATSILVTPFTYEGQLKGVVEFASLNEFSQLHLDFLTQAMSALGIAVNTTDSRTQMKILLESSQEQTRQLEKQSEQMLMQQQELQRANEELQSQSEELQTQQEELRQTNEQLELRTSDLEQQKDEIRQKNEALKITQKEIEQKAHELEISSKYKSEFLANMSHELRTPLNAIMILSQILAENDTGNLTEEQLDYMNTVHSAGTDLLSLINEILDLSKVESGKVDILPEHFSLRELIHKSIDNKFRAIATKKSIDFSITIHDSVPETIYSDLLRVKQVLNNLLSNAIKFTHQGGIRLNVDYHKNEDKPYIAIQVIDTGIGIPENKQQTIFEAFQQADGSTSRKYGGTGLGLSISRQLAKLLGGDITVESQEGKGSTFTLSLPAELPKFDTATNEVQTVSVSEGETKIVHQSIKYDLLVNKKVLLVDDDVRNTFALTTFLKHKKMQPHVAHNGVEALHLLQSHADVDIVLMDIMMPEMDGYEAMQEIRAISQFKELPIIALTAKAMKDDKKKCIDAGASDYITKPIDMDKLLSVMQVWLYR